MVVQSTDKNLMVPVGGAIIASPSKVIVDLISKSYPGSCSGKKRSKRKEERQKNKKQKEARSKHQEGEKESIRRAR